MQTPDSLHRSSTADAAPVGAAVQPRPGCRTPQPVAPADVATPQDVWMGGWPGAARRWHCAARATGSVSDAGRGFPALQPAPAQWLPPASQSQPPRTPGNPGEGAVGLVRPPARGLRAPGRLAFGGSDEAEAVPRSGGLVGPVCRLLVLPQGPRLARGGPRRPRPLARPGPRACTDLP